MTIIGIGIDIVEIKRIKKNILLYPHKLAKRILSHNEWTEYLVNKNKFRFLAKKFAVKEAASKALGTGISQKITFKNFENWNNEYGQPKLRLFKKALIRFK
ncbi:holo-ACP synthase, partial [Buchnera aphidicola (Hormaphis cornu)]